MANAAKIVINQALELTPLERALVAEQLLLSLDQPDSAIDDIWISEAEARIDAHEAGKLASLPADAVFGKYNK